MQSFKQFLTELMVDVDPSKDANTQLTDVRKAQLMAQKSPERVTRMQLDQVRKDRAQVQSSNSPTKQLELQIAQQKERLFRLQQQLAAAQKADSSKQQNAGV